MKKLTQATLAYFAEQGRIGAELKNKNTTPKQRKAIAKKAARARWSKKGGAQ
jgi:hypothetical protein